MIHESRSAENVAETDAWHALSRTVSERRPIRIAPNRRFANNRALKGLSL